MTDPAQATQHAPFRQVLPSALLAPRLARAIVFVVFTAIYANAFTHILYLTKQPRQVALSAGYMLVLLVLQLFYFSRPSAPRSRLRYLALLVQACLVYLPLLEFKGSWVGLPSFFAGSILLSLPAVPGLAGFVAVVVSMGVI
jgi:two-component system sensor histidine kinase DesK